MRQAVLLGLLVAASCHHPYQAESTLVGDGVYVIRSAPEDGQRSLAISEQAAHRRALELCTSGYEVIDRVDGSADSAEVIAVFGRRAHSTPEVVLTVRCR